MEEIPASQLEMLRFYYAFKIQWDTHLATGISQAHLVCSEKRTVSCQLIIAVQTVISFIFKLISNNLYVITPVIYGQIFTYILYQMSHYFNFHI